MQSIVKSYQKKLTNLSGNNRSLLLLRLSEEQDLDLTRLDFLDNMPSFSILENLLEGKNKIRLCKVNDPRHAQANEISSRLKKLWRRERFVFEERGAKDLYVGWPFVKGKFKDGTVVRCPLLFFPVSLTEKEGCWVLEMRTEEEVTFNKSFLLAYAHYNGVGADENLLEKTFEDFSTDSQVFRTELYQLLKESSLEINFNQELFVNKLEVFRNYKKKEFTEEYDTGILKLHSEAVLGLFPQAGSYLLPDFEFLLNNSSYENLEAFFASRSRDISEGRNSVKEEHTYTAFELDASQEAVIREIKSGKSVVVEGPPGTGKSQLICNVISDFIARGKKVLVVCQKRAALDVVYERMKEIDLGEFLALVHDFRNDRKKIFDQIASQIERLDEYQYRNNSLDSIFLEKKFVEVSRKIEQLTEELEDFKKALFDDSECGFSAKELYLTTDPSKPKLDLKQEYRFFKAEELGRFTRTIRNLLPYAERIERSDYLWRDRISFSGFSASDRKTIIDLLDHIPFFLTEITGQIEELTGATMELEEMEWLKDREEQIGQLLMLLEDRKVFSDFVFMLNRNSDKNWLLIREKQSMECFKGSGIEKSLPREQLGVCQKAMERARQARKGLVKWIKWRYFSKDNYLIKRVLIANDLRWNKRDFEELAKRLDNRMNLEHNLTELRSCGWLQDVPDELDLARLSEWFHHQHIALEAKELLKELRVLKEYLNIPSLSYAELRDKLLSLIKIIKVVLAEKKEWQKFLTNRQILKILSGFDYAIDLAKVIRTDFESLVHYDSIIQKLDLHEKHAWHKILNHQSTPSPDLAENFLNSVKLEWLDAIEAKYPVLRTVSSLQMEQMEKELRESIEEKLKLSGDILLMKVREMTYREVEYNRLDNRVTYRDLQHQVTKKKKIWPLRKLIQNFHEELYRLVPCWLASPETVSSIFEMGADFDMVIFDEASQCYAERGIPSIFRGRQILITGDSKQLTPSDFYQIRWEEDDDDNPELEIDSLLDLGKKFLPLHYLKGHYRSKSLELIEFSNQHFYKGRLLAIPEYKEKSKAEPAIEFIKIEGIWENNQNLAEARKVTELLQEIRKKFPEKTVGVVTFNYHQQNLIQDIIEMRAELQPETILVKNIENVQGDERDIIIFSLAYAPDMDGRFSMNFGSLNAQGGENRLNVAVTRAREKIYIVSSIFPEQLQVEELKNEGPKFLKQYLAYARSVSEGKFIPSLQKDIHSSPDWYLKSKLLNLGLSFTLSDEIPFADCTVRNGEENYGLILTDDNFYFQSPSVKELHAYFPDYLTKKGWRFKRVFSRMYWEDKEKLRESLEKALGNHA